MDVEEATLMEFFESISDSDDSEIKFAIITENSSSDLSESEMDLSDFESESDASEWDEDNGIEEIIMRDLMSNAELSSDDDIFISNLRRKINKIENYMDSVRKYDEIQVIKNIYVNVEKFIELDLLINL